MLIIIPCTPESIHTVVMPPIASVLNAEHLSGNSTITVQTSCILVAYHSKLYFSSHLYGIKPARRLPSHGRDLGIHRTHETARRQMLLRTRSLLLLPNYLQSPNKAANTASINVAGTTGRASTCTRRGERKHCTSALTAKSWLTLK